MKRGLLRLRASDQRFDDRRKKTMPDEKGIATRCHRTAIATDVGEHQSPDEEGIWRLRIFDFRLGIESEG